MSSCRALRFVLALANAACFATSNIRAQQPTTVVPVANANVVGSTAAACQKDAARWFEIAFLAASDSAGRRLIKTIDYPAIGSRRNEQLRACVMQLDASKFDGADLLELARTYAQIDEHDAAAASAERFLAATRLTDSVRANALLSMVRQYSLRSAKDLGRAEPYVGQLDAMPNTVNEQKLRAHEGLFSRYQSFDIDLGAQNHALAIIKLAHTLKAQVRSAAQPGLTATGIDAAELMTMYETAANVDGNFGRVTNAIKLLEQARRDHPEIPAALLDSGLSETIARLKLIGQPASAIQSEHWFNAPDSPHASSFTGNVTVLGFTAHWCPPCQTTYGPLQADVRFHVSARRAVHVCHNVLRLRRKQAELDSGA